MKIPTTEDLVAAYHAGKSIRYRTETGFAELVCRKAGNPEGQPRYGFRHSSHQTEHKPLAFLTPSPEQSIRRALIEPKQDGSFRVIEIWDKVAETSPTAQAPETVPLGENVTRCGLRARVIANDYQQDGTPVIALVQIVKGFRAEKAHRYRSDGTHRNIRNLDLVGHLPSPEVSELEHLRRWKAEAMQFLAELDPQAIGDEMGLTIGQSVPPLILPYIRDLKKKLEAAREALK